MDVGRVIVALWRKRFGGSLASNLDGPLFELFCPSAVLFCLLEHLFSPLGLSLLLGKELLFLAILLLSGIIKFHF